MYKGKIRFFYFVSFRRSLRISFDTSVLTERLSAFRSSSSMSSPTSIINLLPASVFSYDGCCFWTGALVTDVVCGDDGVVTVVDDGTGVMMHPVFVNVVAIELETCVTFA